MPYSAINLLKGLINRSKRIAFFGGAGVSTESGIPDFRSANGLYNTQYYYPPEVILSHTFFVNNPKEFYKFYFDKMVYTDKEPNACHLKLAQLEKDGVLSGVITQNIDGLHQKAGSSKVFELHGSIYRNYCEDCGEFYGLIDILKFKGEVPRCRRCGGIIKPDVVLYEELLDDYVIEQSVKTISNCDLLIVAGTSLNVYPAASFISYCNAPIVIINKSATPLDKSAELLINQPIGEVFKQL